ncbi:hypothetical protein DFH09DRAFT_1173044 [Mycena vulgaris]|nr:hypothetical protein DFH09DRAFT_1173044 [Mycena vulgaris]
MEAEIELRKIAGVFGNTPDPYGQLRRRREDLERIVSLSRITRVFDNTPDPYGQLRCQREELERIISRGDTQAFKRLPSELLSEIFLFFLPVTLPVKADEPISVVPQVCRAWNDLVSQSPELWASISVTFDHEGVNVQRITGIAERWLARAGATYPLNITATCVGPYATIAHDNPAFFSSFMNLVLSHAHRLKCLTLNFPVAALLQLLRLPSGSLPCLEILVLQPILSVGDMATPETGYADWHWPAASETLRSAPSIREISYSPDLLLQVAEIEALSGEIEQMMSGEDVGVPPSQHSIFAPSVCLPWSQLNSIHFPFCALTPQLWCSILAECPRLEELSLSLRPPQDGQHSAPPIHLKYLTSLIVFACFGGAEILLDILVTPKLTCLALWGFLAPEAVLAFQARSDFELAVFILGFQITVEDLQSFFGPFPDLKSLGFALIRTDHFPASFWDRICRFELFPTLEELILTPTDAQISYLVDIIEARWESPKLSVKFHNFRPAHMTAVEDELKRLDKYGCAEVKRRVEFF